MIINEIDEKLDMRGKLSFSLDNPFAKVSKELSLISLARMRRKKEGKILIVNSLLSPGFEQDSFAEKLKPFDSKLEGQSLSTILDVSGSACFNFLWSLIEIPSAIIDGILLRGERVIVYFRFHRSDHSKISSLISTHSETLPDLSVDEFKRGSGLKDHLHEISKEVPIYYFEIGSEVPPSSMDIRNDPVITTFGNYWTRETKYLVGDQFHAVYYEKQKIINHDAKLTDISPQENMFEMIFSNPLMKYYFDEATDRSISFLGVGHRLSGRRFSFYLIVPGMHLSNFTKLVFASFKKFKDWKLLLDFATPLDQA